MPLKNPTANTSGFVVFLDIEGTEKGRGRRQNVYERRKQKREKTETKGQRRQNEEKEREGGGGEERERRLTRTVEGEWISEKGGRERKREEVRKNLCGCCNGHKRVQCDY